MGEYFTVVADFVVTARDRENAADIVQGLISHLTDDPDVESAQVYDVLQGGE